VAVKQEQHLALWVEQLLGIGLLFADDCGVGELEVSFCTVAS